MWKAGKPAETHTAIADMLLPFWSAVTFEAPRGELYPSEDGFKIKMI